VQARLVAVDQPGFSHSERGDDLMTPRMGDFILRVADHLRRRAWTAAERHRLNLRRSDPSCSWGRG